MQLQLFAAAALTAEPLLDIGPPRSRSFGVPPSLPEAPDAPYTSEGYRHPSVPDHTWVWQNGFIGSGNDVSPPLTLSVKSALSKCDALPRCRAITFAGDNSTATPKVYFKAVPSVGGSTGWSSWVKRAIVTPPAATLPVGGTSNLTLLLRQTYFTVQNLSRVGGRPGARARTDARTTARSSASSPFPPLPLPLSPSSPPPLPPPCL